jgi:hypothetical protein
VHGLGLELHGIAEHEGAEVAWRAGAEGGHEQALLLARPGHEVPDIARRHFLRIDQQHEVGGDHLADGRKSFCGS